MDEYISREELRKHLKECHDDELFDPDMKKAIFGIDIYIENMPAADVQPVKHGKWVQDKWQDKCTNCEKRLEDLFEGDFYYDCEELHFCPNCGAKMDGDDK